MAIITLTPENVSFGGSGSIGPFHFNVDPNEMNELRNQTGAHSTQTIPLIVRIPKGSVLLPPLPQPQEIHVTALIAIKSNGEQLRDATNKAILPCPPYCDSSA